MDVGTAIDLIARFGPMVAKGVGMLIKAIRGGEMNAKEVRDALKELVDDDDPIRDELLDILEREVDKAYIRADEVLNTD